jgi:hypothetical protein
LIGIVVRMSRNRGVPIPVLRLAYALLLPGERLRRKTAVKS